MLRDNATRRVPGPVRQPPACFWVHLVSLSDKRREASHWGARSRSGLSRGGVDAPYAVLGHHSLIITPLLVRRGTVFEASAGFHVFGLPLPWVVIGGVAHVVIYERVLGMLVLVVTVAHLHMRDDGMDPDERERSVKIQT